MSNPFVLLISNGPAARLLLQSTAAMLAEFKGLRVEHVNKSAAAVSKGELLSDGASLAILATPDASIVPGVQARVEPTPLIVVPMARDPAKGRKLLAAVAGAGAATVALGEAGARNAALLAVAIFAANGEGRLRRALDEFRERQTAAVMKTRLRRI